MDPVEPALPDLRLARPDPPEVQARDARKAAVREALAARGTRVIVTPILIAANVVMFVLVAVQERQIGTFGADALLRWGGSYSPDVTQGAWWRLMTAVFLHGGILHVAFNMFALAVIGPVTERLFGSAAFLVLYALAGLGGSVASEWWQPISVGVGASGAIFGLYGGLFAYLLRRHTTLPRPVVSSLGTGAGLVVVYSIIAGFTQTFIDNAGHLGGLVSGFVAGLVLTPSGEAPKAAVPLWRLVKVAAAGLLITALGAQRSRDTATINATCGGSGNWTIRRLLPRTRRSACSRQAASPKTTAHSRSSGCFHRGGSSARPSPHCQCPRPYRRSSGRSSGTWTLATGRGR